MRQYQAYDTHGRLWNHQYGSMFANDKYETISTRQGQVQTRIVPTGRVLRHDRDIRWLSTVD